MYISVLGIDLGKNSCSVVGLDATGKVVARRRMRRETLITYAAKLPACSCAAIFWPLGSRPLVTMRLLL